MCRKDILGEVSGDGDGTSSALEGLESGDVQKLAVVGDQETTSDGLEKGHGDVSQRRVGNESNVTSDLGQVGGDNRLHVGSVDTEGGVDNLQGRNAEAGNVADGHVEGPDQVREGERQVGAVVVDDERLGDVANLGIDLAEVGVVGDLEAVDGGKVDTIETGQGSISDEDGLGLGDTGGEGERLESIEGRPRDGADTGQRWELEAAHEGQAGELHGSADGAERGGGKGRQLDGFVGNQVTVELLDAVESNVSGWDIGGDLDVTGEGRAAAKGIGIGLAGDGHRCLLADGVCGSCREVQSVNCY
jgi:hypothetical protein